MKKNNFLPRINKYFSSFRITSTSLFVLFKIIFFGAISVEVGLLSFATADIIGGLLKNFGHENLIIVIGLIGIFFVLVYSVISGVCADIKKIFRSKRLDILIAFCFGGFLTVIYDGFFIEWYQNLLTPFNIGQLLTMVLFPFVIGVLVIFRSKLKKYNKNQSSFVEDKELYDMNDDLLGFGDKANNFAESVFNNGASESFVFGIDAPWGIGKSTFVNFCEKYWKENYGKKTIVFKFNPLRYTGSKNLLEIFVNGLVCALQKDSFIPEIRPIISKYSRLLNKIKRFSIFGFDFSTLDTDYDVDCALDDLNIILQRLQKKVIIVVDDLDRMDFSEIKAILFVIRKSFILPNISYILCYDTENIGIFEKNIPDSEKVSEFLEKFVNIKISLYLDRKDLAKYVSSNLDKIISQTTVDPMLVRQPIGGLLDIYKSTSYHKYLPFIGDVRKLKRLINTVVMFHLENTDFKNTDFNKEDIIHLLLIYIHYPAIFRKIYDTEMNGGRGFFSLVLPYDDGYDKPNEQHSTSPSKYRNSVYYEDYINQFPENSHQRFLLDKIFNVNIRLKDSAIDNIPEDIRTSLACINGGWTNGRNLEAYLNLVANLSRPEETAQHKPYANYRDKIINGRTTISDVFKSKKFDHNTGEQSREKLLRMLVNNARDLDLKIATNLINYILDYKQDYSILEIEKIGIGLRGDMDYFIVRLLNDAGWSDKSGKHSHNVAENIKEIAEWIFGEEKHVNNGILFKLSNPSFGVLGLYDLMSFRLLCSSDRGGDIFDLSRALSLHGNEKAPTEGDTRIIAKEEMREISQRVFAIFKTQYIDNERNIFSEIQSLTVEQLTGKSYNYLNNSVNSGIIKQEELDKNIIELKTGIANFIIYQLGNDLIYSGVGCGFYDVSGNEDNHKIKQLINDYLFNTCFNLSSPTNAEYFIDYLFRNFASIFESAREDGFKYVPTIKEFTKVLDEGKLASYWRDNSTTLKALNLEQKDKIVYLGNNNEASYRDYIPLVFQVLDNHATSFSPPISVD